MPECLEAYLPNENEEETETEENVEFPNFNKLVDELILIKKLLNKPWIMINLKTCLLLLLDF